jgi:DNA-binding GntR family transcriptional regulator
MNLTEKIEKDIISHLAAGKKPCQMTVASLASHYEVSSTPIRIAISTLIDSGIIVKLPNGRLQTVLDFESSEILKETESSVEKDPYELILRAIVEKSLSQVEEFIREESTAEKFGLSRSAVREIFLRISGQGILEHIPRRGWRIRPFSQNDLNAYLKVRETMELNALDMAWGKLLDIDIQEMRDGNIPTSSKEETPVIDNRLHAYIIDKSDNFYIQDFFKRHDPFFNILFEWEGEDHDAAAETVIQHHAILDAILNRDKASASKALAEHIHYNHPVIKNFKVGV